MIFIILGGTCLVIGVFASAICGRIRMAAFGFSLFCVFILSGAIVNYGLTIADFPIITESSEKYNIEYMDKEIVHIEGTGYNYEFRYDKNAEEPYAVLAKVENDFLNVLYNLLAWEKAEDMAYVYTNEIELIPQEGQ